ncbi:MAG: translocation/assembly module TamB domain-containing protein [Cytophagales bacterium]|nr:translocation/assembly module TamB domain-containing protein [Cytophagales bacterium]
MSNKATHILLKTGKILGFIVLGILGLFAVVWLAIQVPSVQTAITRKVTQNLSKKLGTTVRIAAVDIDFFKTVVLEGIYVEDQQKDTLLYAGKLRVNIGILSLANKMVTANLIGLEEARANVYKAKGDTAFNYEFIPAAFASTDTTQDTTASAWNFDLLEVNLDDVRITFRDETQGNDLRLALDELDLDLKTLGLQEQYPRINNLTIDGLRTSFAQVQAEADTLVAAAAETTQLDTLAEAGRKAVADAQDERHVPARDTVESPFNDSGWRLALNQLTIRNTDLRYDVTNAAPAAGGMDFNHLAVQDLLLEIADVAVGANDFALNVNNFSFREKSGFALERLALEFRADLPRATLRLEELRTPNSRLDDGIAIGIPSINDTDNLVQTVELTARFAEDYLSTKDAAYFTDALDAYPGLEGRSLQLDGEMTVREGTARTDNLTAKVDDNNYVTLNAVVRDLTNLNETYADVSITPLRTSTAFINSILPAGTLPPEFAKAGNIDLRADVRGHLRDLVGNINLQTSAGQIRTNFTAGTDTSFTRQTFNGRVNVDGVELDKFLGKASGLGEITASADVRGSRNGDDISVPEADVNLARLGYNGYTYRDIRMQGSYVNQVAKALLNANDPNLKATIDAVANMAGKEPKFEMAADLKDVDLWSLHLYNDTITLSGRMNARLAGTDPDKMTGRVAVENFQARKPSQTYKLDSMVLSLGRRGAVRTINIGSNIFNAFIEGQFTVKELPIAMDQFVKKYFTNYPADPTKVRQAQTVWFDLRVNPYPEILEAFAPDLNIHEAITVKGHFASDSSSLALRVEVPQASMAAQGVTNLVFDAHTEDESLRMSANASQIKVSDSTKIPTPSLSATIQENDLQFGLRLAADEADTRLRLNGRFQMKKDTFIVSFLPSELFLKKQEWTLAENSRVVYAPKYVQVQDLTLVRNAQRIAIDGTSTNGLGLTLDSISIADLFALLPPMGYTADGWINGKAQLANLFETPAVQADVRVDSLKLNQNAIGNIALTADRQASGWIGMKLTLLGNDNDLRAEGRYNPGLETDNISFDIVIARILLKQFEPFVKDYASMDGLLTADLRLRGSVTEPDLTGQLTFPNTTIIPKMLGAPFTLTNQAINFGNQSVVFNQFTITDAQKRTAVLDGSLSYADLANLTLDLNFSTDGFQFVNSTYGASESFYGTANAAANIRMIGPVSQLRITGRLNTLEGTEMFIPTYDVGGAEVSQEEYITYVDKDLPPPSILGNKQEEEPTAMAGMSLNLQASVDSSAVFHILLDPLTNDRIQASGNGDFNVRLTPQGDLLVFGVYTIQEGSYAMNLFGAIKKKFGVREGGTITLNGRPEEAVLNLTAVYEVETSLEPLLSDGASNEALKNAQEVPVEVLINIAGNTEELNIGFDIAVPQEGNSAVGIEVEDQLNQIRQNENELNKQAFGLIALNRFISSNGLFAGGSGGGATAAVTENIDKSLSSLLSQQLSNLSEDYLGVEISVDIQSQNQMGSEMAGLDDRNVGLNLSKSLFNNRLSITVGSNIPTGGGSNAAGQSTNQNVIGDFTVSYKITPNGSMTLRFFRRNEQSQLGLASNTERIGASLAHSKSFSTVKELFTSRSRKRKPLKTKGVDDNTTAGERPRGQGDVQSGNKQE